MACFSCAQSSSPDVARVDAQRLGFHPVVHAKRKREERRKSRLMVHTRGRASSFSSWSFPPSSSSATSATPCTSEQPLSLSAKLAGLEVAAGDDDDDDDDDDELIIMPKDRSSKVSALGLERPGDG